jgi:hypothetical protein
LVFKLVKRSNTLNNVCRFGEVVCFAGCKSRSAAVVLVPAESPVPTYRNIESSRMIMWNH